MQNPYTMTKPEKVAYAWRNGDDTLYTVVVDDWAKHLLLRAAISRTKRNDGQAGMARLLRAHKAAHEAGWGADAMLLVEAQQWRLNANAVGKTNFLED